MLLNSTFKIALKLNYVAINCFVYLENFKNINYKRAINIFIKDS